MEAAKVQEIDLGSIKESGTNPRQGYDEGKLKELAESIKEKGVLQPILVRPHENNGYQIVFGHRRLRAARLAGLKLIPAMVKVMNDQTVLEAQLIENCNREDIHPLEEAEGYRQLMKLYKYTAEDLAIKVGKSKAYVYARLKLSELPTEAKKKFHDGKLNPSTALLIARIPNPKLQIQATKEITSVRWSGEVMSYREAANHIQQRYMLRLSQAPFPTADAKLYPQAGPCSTCPKRTGNQKELFSDIKSADVCTDPDCFAEKKNRSRQKTIAEARAKGQTVLDEKETKKVFYVGNQVTSASGYFDLVDRCWDDPKNRNWQKLLGKNMPEVILAIDPTGKIHQVVRQGDARKALKAAGYNFKVESWSSSGPEQKKRQREAKIYNETVSRAITQLIDKIEKTQGDFSAKVWQVLAAVSYHYAWYDIQKKVAGRRLAGQKLKPAAGRDIFKTHIKKMNGKKAKGLIIELIIARAVNQYGYGEKFGKEFIELCRHFGINIEKLHARVKEENRKSKTKLSRKKAPDGK